MKLSIVIPARNEAENIEKTLIGLRLHLDSVGIRDCEYIVVDDGSTDETDQRVKELANDDPRICCLRNTSSKHGYGRAVAMGLEHFTGDAVIVCMADASDDPKDVERYYYVLRDRAEAAFGSRWIQGSEVINYPRSKLFINRLANQLIRLLFNIPYNDVTNAFKGYRANVIKGCQPFISPHFNLTIEIPLKAIVRGYSYEVIPIAWYNRDIGVSQLKLKEQGSRYLYTLLTIWFEWLLVRGDTMRASTDVFTPMNETSQPTELM